MSTTSILTTVGGLLLLAAVVLLAVGIWQARRALGRGRQLHPALDTQPPWAYTGLGTGLVLAAAAVVPGIGQLGVPFIWWTVGWLVALSVLATLTAPRQGRLIPVPAGVTWVRLAVYFVPAVAAGALAYQVTGFRVAVLVVTVGAAAALAMASPRLVTEEVAS